MERRAILLHCHIFKNAGSTIDLILKHNFGEFARSLESKDGCFLSAEAVVGACLQDRNLMSLSSHKIGLPAPHHAHFLFIPLVMLRNPLDRLGSIYAFYRRQKITRSSSYECLFAQRSTFREFVATHLYSGNDSSFANLQTQFFLGPGQGLSEETWVTVETNFRNAQCVGIVERFDESIVLWRDYLSIFFPQLDFSCRKANVSADRAKTLAERIAELEKELGLELLDLFRKRNQFDYRLYALAQKRLEREIKLCNGFSDKLDFFRRLNNLNSAAERGALQIDDSKRANFSDERDEKSSTVGCPLILVKDGRNIDIPSVPQLGVDPKSQQVARIIGCGLFDGAQKITIVDQGMPVCVWIVIKSWQEISHFIVGVTVKDRRGEIMFTMNSILSSSDPLTLTPKPFSPYCFQFIMPQLNQGAYSITPAIATGTLERHTTIDSADDSIVFFIPAMCEPRMPGVLFLQHVEFGTL